MQTSCNGIHMLYSIQTHEHIDTSNMKIHINHIIHYHHAMHAFCTLSSYHSFKGTLTQMVLLLDVEGTSTQQVLHVMLMGLSLKRSYLWCWWDSHSNGLTLVRLMGLHPNGLVAWCRWDSHLNGLTHGANETLTQTVSVQCFMFSFFVSHHALWVHKTYF
jgi:hypothetical protein